MKDIDVHLDRLPPQNLEAVRRIAAAVECPIQVGGGLRDATSVGAVLAAGVLPRVYGPLEVPVSFELATRR